jgi:hypothetical protein
LRSSDAARFFSAHSTTIIIGRERSFSTGRISDDNFTTSVASRETITFLPARRTLTLEKFKYALESWRQIPAIAFVAFLQIFHCNA